MRLQQQNISTVNFHTYILFLYEIHAVWEMVMIETCICMARKSQQMCASGTLKTQSYICQHLILIVLLDCDQTRHIMISNKSHLFHVSLSFRLWTALCIKTFWQSICIVSGSNSIANGHFFHKESHVFTKVCTIHNTEIFVWDTQENVSNFNCKYILFFRRFLILGRFQIGWFPNCKKWVSRLDTDVIRCDSI